jgi:hypothetical protein
VVSAALLCKRPRRVPAAVCESLAGPAAVAVAIPNRHPAMISPLREIIVVFMNVDVLLMKKHGLLDYGTGNAEFQSFTKGGRRHSKSHWAF